MFWRTVSGYLLTSNPTTSARPDVGFSSPQSMRIVVDLPAPFGPRKPKISPLRTVRLTWSTATKLPNRLTRFSTTTELWFSGMSGSPRADRVHKQVFNRWRDLQNRIKRNLRTREPGFKLRNAERRAVHYHVQPIAGQ